jgi:hypothetical protein
MAPTIRIDDEVYAWLQKNARAFEDTPNSVLRRVAGLDNQAGPATGTAPTAAGAVQTLGPRSVRGRSGLTGQQLNEEWKVGAQHALYHADGTWYENLKKFPGGLFDRYGYVLFENAESFKKSTFLKIGEKTNVPRGISKMPGYVRKRAIAPREG